MLNSTRIVIGVYQWSIIIHDVTQVTSLSGTIVVTLHMKQVNTVLLRSYLVMKRVLSWEMKQKNSGAT